VLAHGCNIGLHTIAQITQGVTYKQLKRVSDWQMTEERRFAMPETFALSDSAVAVLRFRVKGYRTNVTDGSLEAFRELAADGIMEPMPGADGKPSADCRFTEDGWARRQELLSREE